MRAGCGLVNASDIVLAAKLGFSYVELLGRQLASMSDEEFYALERELWNAGIGCEGINGYCPPEIVIAGPRFDPDAAAGYSGKLAERGKALGVRVVGIGSPFSRTLPEGYDRSVAKTQLAEFLKITAEAMGKYGITVCLEALAPCYCNFINCAEEAIEITREIGWESIKVVLDYYNMEYTGEADSDMGDWIGDIAHVHISDDAGSPLKRYFLGADKCGLHRKRLGSLVQNGYKGTATLEVDLPVNRDDAAYSLEILDGI